MDEGVGEGVGVGEGEGGGHRRESSGSCAPNHASSESKSVADALGAALGAAAATAAAFGTLGAARLVTRSASCDGGSRSARPLDERAATALEGTRDHRRSEVPAC